ncbi:MAG: ROK family protein, partial [Spirochaetota bacterium]
FRLANDGDVTALAGAMLLKKNNLLGIAMGTSEAAGYANAQGSVNSWFSELAFVPVDMGSSRSQDEWSKDWGTGVEYFSQQAVIRLAPKAGIELPAELAKPRKLSLVQEKLSQGHEGAANIYRSIGCYLAYALPWYHRFYRMENVLLLGRVLKGEGGKILLAEAEKVLAAEFPQLKLQLFTLSDDEILHGQAMAAASLA